ncbi:Uncharacterised protein [Staphylococcus aureus]|nr:Uncharacterised protein [Staphylococcus aureus]
MQFLCVFLVVQVGLVSGGSVLLAVVYLEILGSYFKRIFTIKWPLGKDVAKIIENYFGEPV